MTALEETGSGSHPTVRHGRLGAGLLLISLAVATTIFIFDLSMPLGVAGGVPYVALVLIGLWSPWPSYCLSMAVVATLLTGVGHEASENSGVPWMVWTNRSLALFAIWVVAILVFRWKKIELEKEAWNRNLEQQIAERTAALQKINERLEAEVTERIGAEQALREGNLQLVKAQKQAKIGNWRWSLAQNKLTSWSEEFARLFGVPMEQAPTTNEELSRFHHPEDRERVLALYSKSADAKSDFEIEYRIVRADGTVRHIRELGELAYDASGRATDLIGTFQDISKIRDAQNELRESEQRFRDIAEVATDWIWETDEHLRTSYISERFQLVTGLTRDQVLGRSRYELADPNFIDENWSAHLADLEARRAFRGFRYTYAGPNGRRQHWSISGAPVFDWRGTFRGYRGTGTDRTAEVEGESALRNREQRLRGILDNLTEGVVTIHESGTIDSFNAAAVRMFGYLPEEVVGLNVNILMSEPDRSQHEDYIENYRSGGESKIIGIGPREVSCVRKDGSVFPAELTISDMQLDGSRIFIGAVRDITERKRIAEEREDLEARFRQSQKMEGLGTLAGGIAHDLNNVLVPVLGLTELTLEDLPAGGVARANLERILKAARRGRALVAQILAFSRRGELNRKPEDLPKLIREISSLLRATLPSTIEIREQLEETLGMVTVDSTQIHQVLMNLGSNARDAMGMKPGVLEIVLNKVEFDDESVAQRLDVKPGRYASMTISDTGSGMDQDTIQRIFEPFYTSKAVGEGTGLGLSVVHGIIAAHGGAIDVQSQVGRGTTFEILLPLAPDAID